MGLDVTRSLRGQLLRVYFLFYLFIFKLDVGFIGLFSPRRISPSTSLCADPCVTSATQYNTTQHHNRQLVSVTPGNQEKPLEHFPVIFFFLLLFAIDPLIVAFLSVFVCLALVCRVVVWAVQSVKSSWALSQCRDLRVEPQIPSLPPSHAGRLLCWRFFGGIVYCYYSSGRESPLTFPLTLHEISINLKTICFLEKYFQCSLQTFVSSMCVFFLTVVGKCEIIFRNSTDSKGYLWRNIYSLMKLMIKAH